MEAISAVTTTIDNIVLVLSLKIPAPNKSTPPLKRMPCIYYLVWFKKDRANVLALFDSNSKVKTINLAYTTSLGLKIWPTNVKAQKINNSSLQTFGIVQASFQVNNKLGRYWFFQQNFLITNINMALILDMPFLTFSNTNVLFAERKLIWQLYTLAETLPTTTRV